MYHTIASSIGYIGLVYASVILLMGIISAFLYLFDAEAEWFWKRIWPAVGILLATSVIAVLVMLLMGWIANAVG